MVEVRLTPAEMLLAAHAASMRQVENLKSCRQNAYGANRADDWKLHIMGCMGEMAYAKHFNVWWPGKGRFRDYDVDGVEIRTAQRHTDRCIVKPEDEDDKWVWLVTGLNGLHKIHGRILALEAKQERWWTAPNNDGRFNYFVPQAALTWPEIY